MTIVEVSRFHKFCTKNCDDQCAHSYGM